MAVLIIHIVGGTSEDRCKWYFYNDTKGRVFLIGKRRGRLVDDCHIKKYSYIIGFMMAFIENIH